MRYTLLLLWSIFCLSLSVSFAQYAITEIGIAAGPGYNYPLKFGSTKVKGHIGAQANVYCSRYFCGKPYGFHAFVGYRGFARFTVNKKEDALFTDIRLHYAELGLLFKIRKNKFNRPRENAFLFGPVADICFRERNKGTVPAEGRTFLLGAQASLWLRREYHRRGVFIQPGVQAMLLPFFKRNVHIYAPFTTRLFTIYPFINVAFSLKTIRG